MNSYSHKHANVIKRLTSHGLKLVSTPRQLRKNSLIFTDQQEPNVKYGIFETGYVRKGRPGNYGFEWWQLNPTEKKEILKHPGYFCTTRILLDNYNDMCNIIIRVSNKSRTKLNKNK